MSKRLLRLKAAETTWGVTPAVGAGDMVDVPVQSCSFAVEAGYSQNASLGGGRNFRLPMREVQRCGGTVEVYLNPMAHCYLLNDLLGGPTTVGTGPYTHTWKVPTALPVGASFEVGDTGAGLYNVFSGMRCGQATFRFREVGPIEASFEYVGKTDATATSSLDSSPTAHTDLPFDLAAASVTANIGGAAFSGLRLAEIQVSNDPRQARYYIGGGGVPGKQPMGRQTRITGRIEYDPADWAFYEAAKSGTESSLEFVVQNGTGDGSAGNEYLQIKVPELKWHIRTPSVLGDDDEPLTGEAEFTAFLDDAAEGSSLVVVVKNTLATIG